MADTTLEKLIEKLPEESDVEYAAFLFFSSLSPKDRHDKSMVPKVSEYSGLKAFSVWQARSEHKWFERASLVDAHNWLVENQKRRDIMSEETQRFVEQTSQIKEDSINASRKMLAVANNLLDSAVIAGQTIETDIIETKDGRKVPTYTTINMKSKISDIPRLVDTAVKVSRLAAELPTEILEADVIANQDLSQLTDEELVELRQKNHKFLLEQGILSKLDGDTLIG